MKMALNDRVDEISRYPLGLLAMDSSPGATCANP